VYIRPLLTESGKKVEEQPRLADAGCVHPDNNTVCSRRHCAAKAFRNAIGRLFTSSQAMRDKKWRKGLKQSRRRTIES